MNTHVEIRRPAFSSFLKAEVAEFASSTIGIVQSKDPESLLIAPLFDSLDALSPEIELLSLRYGVDPKRMKVETLKQKLMLTISTLKLQVRLISKSSNDEGLFVINSFMDSYLRHLNAVKKNNKVVTQQVEGFINSVASDAALARALADHDLIEYVTMIEVALEDFREAVSSRLTTLANRPKVDTQQIVSKISTAINNLFKGIEVKHLLNPELDYKPLADELNELVDAFRLSVRLRTSYNRRKAEEKEMEEMDQSDDPEIDEEGQDENEEGTDVQTTSTRAYGGFAPFSLSVEPESDEDDPFDDWEESYDEELEDGEEFVEEGVEGSEEEQ